MTRSVATVTRINKRYAGPFGGMSDSDDPRVIGPTRAEVAEDVLLSFGYIRRRGGLVGPEEGNERDPGEIPFENLQGMHSALIPTTLGEHRILIVAKNGDQSIRRGYYTTQMLAGSGDWHEIPINYSGTADFVNFYTVAQFGRKFGSNGDAFGAIVYMLKSENWSHKTTGPFSTTVGMATPALAGSVSGSHPGYEMLVSFSNRLQAPEGSSWVVPGQESNAVGPGEGTPFTPGTTNFVRRRNPDDGHFHTHARVYVKDTNAGETVFSLVEIVALGEEFAEGLPNEFTAGDPIGDDFQFNYDPETYPKGVNGGGAYDHPPTRNDAPIRMKYFALRGGRGFWARPDESVVYYSDQIGPITGGHAEALSGDFVGPLTGNVSMLAEYYGQLLIGTSNALYKLVGPIVSHTNSSIHTGADIPQSPESLDRIDDAIPPAANGLGSHVIAEGILYYITNRGLAAYNGVRSIDVSDPIQKTLGDEQRAVMDKAMLVLDPARKVIFMLTPAGGNDARIFVYHYSTRGNEVSAGEWSVWSAEGGTQMDNMQTISLLQRTPQSEKTFLWGRLRTNATAELGIYSHKALKDVGAHNPSWKWQSGALDLGVPERRKRFHYLTVHLEPQTHTCNMRIGFVISDPEFGVPVSWEKQFQFGARTREVKIAIGIRANNISIFFRAEGTDARNLNKIVGFYIDAELVDHR